MSQSRLDPATGDRALMVALTTFVRNGPTHRKGNRSRPFEREVEGNAPKGSQCEGCFKDVSEEDNAIIVQTRTGYTTFEPEGKKTTDRRGWPRKHYAFTVHKSCAEQELTKDTDSRRLTYDQEWKAFCQAQSQLVSSGAATSYGQIAKGTTELREGDTAVWRDRRHSVYEQIYSLLPDGRHWSDRGNVDRKTLLHRFPLSLTSESSMNIWVPQGRVQQLRSEAGLELSNPTSASHAQVFATPIPPEPNSWRPTDPAPYGAGYSQGSNTAAQYPGVSYLPAPSAASTTTSYVSPYALLATEQVSAEWQQEEGPVDNRASSLPSLQSVLASHDQTYNTYQSSAASQPPQPVEPTLELGPDLHPLNKRFGL